ncbi:MAG: MraY family glycosyltransferase [Rectinemataceae bacterium]|nr:MraY family glycosyltransferase [Rectinemataceae bacterium]
MPLIFILLSCALASTLVPAILYFAHSKGIYDKLSARKIHNGNIPRLGGVGITLAFLATVVVMKLFQAPLAEEFSNNYPIWPILASGIAMFSIGLIDDLIDLRARFKFIIEALIAIFLIAWGFRFQAVSVPWGDGGLELGLLSWPVTFLWIIGITNAMNLIDGLDGLAGGVAFIASMTFGLFFWTQGSIMSAQLCFAVSGSVAGFLIFNLPPAKIFMGDSGSLFLGFCLAILPLLSQGKARPEIGIISASTVLAIPIFDTLSAMYRRTKAHVSFFTADNGHFHHVLLRMVQLSSSVLLIICGINVLLALAALSTLFLSQALSFSIKLGALAAIGIVFYAINRRSIKDGSFPE